MNDEANDSDLATSDAPREIDAESEILSGDARRRLVTRFETWLDRIAAGEAPPEGLPAEFLSGNLDASPGGEDIAPDLYTIFSSLTALSGEIRLQGRAFRQLSDALAPLSQLSGRFDRLEAAQTSVAEELSAITAEDASGESVTDGLPPARDAINVLFDLYDRLDRGLRNFDDCIVSIKQQSNSASVMRRLLGGKAIADGLIESASALREGYELTLSRLDSALRQWGVQRVGVIGEMFDPEKMNAIETQNSSSHPDGAVLEVFRSGYLLHGNLLSTAQVKVCRNPGT